MKFVVVETKDAQGTILAHNLYDEMSQRILNKGRCLSEADITKLLSYGFDTITVAQADENDIHENDAARRIGNALAGQGIAVKAPGVGRANLMSSVRGVLRVNAPILEQVNNIYDGISIASMREHSLINAKELVTLVKIVPFFVPNARVLDIERLTADASSVISVRPLQSRKVALIISGPQSVREKLLHDFDAPVRQRIEFLDSELIEPIYVSHNAETIANALRDCTQYDLILVASVSAIIDIDDIVPTALRMAGGTVTIHGVPVDPGTLLMMGYLNDVPVVGAPGCIKSPKVNVIDWVLPRLLSGERLTRANFVRMGHGGLLQDITNRPMPRNLHTS